MEQYKGQYSFCPVATETVVLSLPRMIGTKEASTHDSFWLMMFLKSRQQEAVIMRR